MDNCKLTRRSFVERGMLATGVGLVGASAAAAETKAPTAILGFGNLPAVLIVRASQVSQAEGRHIKASEVT